MKVDVTQALKDFEGTPLYRETRKRDEEGKTIRNERGEPVLEDEKMTLRAVINTALIAEKAEGKPRTSEDKNEARPILKKLWENKMVSFTTKQAGYIIEKVEEIYNPLIIERVNEAFDEAGGDDEGEKEDKKEKKK